MARKRENIPEKVKLLVWAKSAGRCEICNTPIYEDPMTFEQVNVGDHAHIIGSSPDGPRGDKKLSPELATDPANIILLCKTHHKKIDTQEFIEKYSPDLLRELKRQHEERIEFVTSIGADNKSHILLYGAKIGNIQNPLDFNQVSRGMFPDKYPAEKHPISIQIVGSEMHDEQADYWNVERINLQQKFTRLVKERIERSEITHLSVFALAPIPLLIELGTLLTDKTAVDTYQLLREPKGWKWQTNINNDKFEYLISHTQSSSTKTIAIILSLSGTIADKDVRDILGDDVAIWNVTIEDVNNDFMKSKEQLSLFRKTFRKLLDSVKEKNGRDSVIHLFPAIPISVAIEIGRVWMPKADLPIVIYDRNRAKNLSFVKTFRIG